MDSGGKCFERSALMTEIPVLSIILAVALSVLINLIIMLIMKKRSKNSRTVKMVNDQIQAFRK